MLGILEEISPSELVPNGYISNHTKVRRPRPKFKVSFLYFCCSWINVTQMNYFTNICKKKNQRIISDYSYFQLKSRFNVDARAPSIPLLNFPFKTRLRTPLRQSTDLYVEYSSIHRDQWDRDRFETFSYDTRFETKLKKIKADLIQAIVRDTH